MFVCVLGKDVIQRSGKEGTCEVRAPGNQGRHGRKRLSPSGNSNSVPAKQDPGECKRSDQEGPVVSSKDVPESLSSITSSHIDVDIVSRAVPTEELEEGSKRKTTATTDEEGERASHPESHSSVQSQSLPEKSHRSHPESSSAPSSPDASHTHIADSVLGCSEDSEVRRTSCMYGANCYR